MLTASISAPRIATDRNIRVRAALPRSQAVHNARMDMFNRARFAFGTPSVLLPFGSANSSRETVLSRGVASNDFHHGWEIAGPPERVPRLKRSEGFDGETEPGS